MNTIKKVYDAPTVAAYGTVQELTRQSNLPNADTPGGTDGTAYSP
jgi:hypothetical protein